MTAEEKYSLIETCESGVQLLMTKDQVIDQSQWLSLDELCIRATRYLKNSCTTYFYDSIYYYNTELKCFCFKKWSTYFSCPNQAQNAINSFLDDVVVIMNKRGNVLWYDEKFFRSNGIYLVGGLVVTEDQVADLLRKYYKDN